jgi:hypothetical protein
MLVCLLCVTTARAEEDYRPKVAMRSVITVYPSYVRFQFILTCTSHSWTEAAAEIHKIPGTGTSLSQRIWHQRYQIYGVPSTWYVEVVHYEFRGATDRRMTFLPVLTDFEPFDSATIADSSVLIFTVPKFVAN